MSIKAIVVSVDGFVSSNTTRLVKRRVNNMKIILWGLFWLMTFATTIAVICIAKSSGDYNRKREQQEELNKQKQMDREEYADEHFGCSDD